MHRLEHPGAGPRAAPPSAPAGSGCGSRRPCWTCSCRTCRARGSAAASSRSGSCVTTQSVTCQPCRPCRSVSRTVSSTAVKNASGIEPELDAEPERDPGADRRRLDPQPDRGQERVRRACRSARRPRRRRPAARCRSWWSRGTSTSTPYSSASVACDDLLLHLAVERDGRSRRGRRPAAGRSAGPARRAGSSAACSAPLSVAVGAARRPSPAWAARSGASGAVRAVGSPIAVADPHVAPGRTAGRSGRPAADAARHRGAVARTRSIAVTCSAAAPSPTRQPVPRRAACPANIRTYAIFSPAGPRSTLNTVPDGRAVGVAGRRRQQLGDAGRSAPSTPAPVIAEPKNTGCTAPRPVCAASAARSRWYGPRRVVDVGGEQRVVVLGQRARPATAKPASRRAAGRARRAVPSRGPCPSRRCRGVSLSAISASTPSVARPGAVDLVDEDQRRDAQPAQRAHQHPGLRLHALDRGDHQHGAVEHAEHPLDLGDEVRVAGRVDQVDGDVAERERRPRRT